jgi:predicted DNA-binding protein (MmcQ/YjbR family)
MPKKKRARAKSPSASKARRASARRAGEATPARSANEFRPVSRELREFAMGLPGATEDFPWGDRVAKVNGKVFVFLGLDQVPGGPIGLSVKLPDSHEEALDLPFTKPTAYGLGKSGWVTATFQPGQEPPVEILKTWIAESYRAIAPKKLVAKMESSDG